MFAEQVVVSYIYYKLVLLSRASECIASILHMAVDWQLM